MSAHYPSDRTTAERERGILPSVKIGGQRVTIDEITLPGIWIARDSVGIHAGGRDNINRLTITFLVGEIDVTDDAIDQVKVNESIGGYWYSGDDGEVCPECMTKTLRG